MTRFSKFKPGEREHITIVSGADGGTQVLECGICKGRWGPQDAARGRKRFAKQHWIVTHTKCAASKAETT